VIWSREIPSVAKGHVGNVGITARLKPRLFKNDETMTRRAHLSDDDPLTIPAVLLLPGADFPLSGEPGFVRGSRGLWRGIAAPGNSHTGFGNTHRRTFPGKVGLRVRCVPSW